MRHKLAIEPRILVAAVFLYLLYGVYLQLDQGLTYSSQELFSTSDRSDTNTTNLKTWWLISRNSWQNKAAFQKDSEMVIIAILVQYSQLNNSFNLIISRILKSLIK